MKLHFPAQFLSDQNFFGFSPKNLGAIYTNVFFLVNWGFSYEEIMNLDLDEVREYIKLWIEVKENEKKAADKANKIPQQEQKPIGEVIPHT